MSHALELDATRFFLSKSIAGVPVIKKNAARFADQLSSYFVLYLDQAIADVSKGKTITPEDVIKALKENGLDDYVSVFKESMKEEAKETSESDMPKKQKREKGANKEKKSKKD